MRSRDTISGSLGECFVTIDGNRYNFMTIINIEAVMNKNKGEVPLLGKSGRGNKTNGWNGTGSATMHYATSMFRELAYRYAQTGEDFYFDIQLTNEDPTSAIGRQTVILKDCNMDSVVLAKLDAEAEYLSEDFDFTFEDFRLPEKFNKLPGMEL